MASVVAGASHTDDVGSAYCSQLVLWRGSCSLLKEFSLLILALTVTVFVYVFLLFQAIAHYLIRKPFFHCVFVLFICLRAHSHMSFISLKLRRGSLFILTFINDFGDSFTTLQVTVTCTLSNSVIFQVIISRKLLTKSPKRPDLV